MRKPVSNPTAARTTTTPAKAKTKAKNPYSVQASEALQLGLYFSKMRHGFMEEWFQLKNGRPASKKELRAELRVVANKAIDRLLAEELERMQPGRISGSKGEVF